MKRGRRTLTHAELAVAILLLLVVTALLLPALARSREASKRASCQNNLKQFGIVVKMFANENRGKFPPVSPIPDNWTMDLDAVYPEYVSDLAIFICPSSPMAKTGFFTLKDDQEHPGAQVGALHPDCISSLFYVYTGYTIFSDEQALALFETYCAAPYQVIGQEKIELPVPVWEGSNRIHAPGMSGIPIMWDRVSPHDWTFSHREPLGGNVLHMDGHVEFVRYSFHNNSNYFPMTRVCAETFGSVLPTLSSDCCQP